MSEFTYQKEDTKANLETFEWDNVWWEHTENKSAKRVLYIGDSISCGIRRLATELSGNTVLFDGFGTSKALDNPYFKDALAVCIRQESRLDAILFNNGLHGWHLSDEAYENEYRRMVDFIKSLSDAPLFIVLTTIIKGSDMRNETIIKRNAVARKTAKEYGLECIDLFSASVKYDDWHVSDSVHFLDEGYRKFAKQILDTLNASGI